MGGAGILREDERVELIEGGIVEMDTIGGRHVRCVNELNWLLGQQIRDGGLRVSVQNLIRLNGGLEPQPDLAVVRVRDYGESLPGPEDGLLVTEVSDATLGYDRNVKLPLYARAGIREAWIVWTSPTMPSSATATPRKTATSAWSEQAGGARSPQKPSRTSPSRQMPYSAMAEDRPSLC